MNEEVTVMNTQPHIITSGPMSEGMLQMRSNRPNESTEHICMFSVCLMFIGIPIIVVGIICLTLYPPIGVILLIIGAVASTSGAFLAIVSAIVSAFKKQPLVSAAQAHYGQNGQTPEITVEADNYIEYFGDNLCEEPPQQLSASNLSNRKETNDLTKLDPVYWTNYPEAQDPKSYLNSFGELPKALPSPEPSALPDGQKQHKICKNSTEKIKRKLSKTMKMGVNRRTISRTELTRDYSDEIHTDTSSSSCSSPVIDSKTNQYMINADKVGGGHKNGSIITIENFELNLTDDNNSSSVMVAESGEDYATDNATDYTNNENMDINCVVEERIDIEPKIRNTIDNKYVSMNGINKNSFSDDCEVIEFMVKPTDADVLVPDTTVLKNELSSDDDLDNYDNLWNIVHNKEKH